MKISEKGQGLVEYALILQLITAVVLIVLRLIFPAELLALWGL